MDEFYSHVQDEDKLVFCFLLYFGKGSNEKQHVDFVRHCNKIVQ